MSNSNMSPIFPMPDPHHYFLTDHGFNPQFHYSQVLEEARKHKKERAAAAAATAHQFKKKHGSSSRSKRWLKNAFRFIRAKITHWPVHQTNHELHELGSSRVYQVRAALSGPLYVTESTIKSATPYRTSRSRSVSGQNFAKERIIPYINLRELNMDQHPRKSNTAPLPIYLVT